jgi:hypothetical protein
MPRPSGDSVASGIEVVCSKSATLTGAALACTADSTLCGSVATRSAGPEEKARTLEAESRSKRPEERIIRTSETWKRGSQIVTIIRLAGLESE